MTSPSDLPPPEFSAPVDLADLAPSRARFEIEADAKTRARIAVRLGAPEVERLSGEFVLKPTWRGLMVEGRLRARLARQCVASLTAMTEEIDTPFTIAFAREAASEPDRNEDAAFDAPEPLQGDTLDLGELLVQELALTMNPYPRRTDADPLEATGGEPERDSPFAALAGRDIAEPDPQE